MSYKFYSSFNTFRQAGSGERFSSGPNTTRGTDAQAGGEISLDRLLCSSIQLKLNRVRGLATEDKPSIVQQWLEALLVVHVLLWCGGGRERGSSQPRDRQSARLSPPSHYHAQTTRDDVEDEATDCDMDISEGKEVQTGGDESKEDFDLPDEVISEHRNLLNIGVEEEPIGPISTEPDSFDRGIRLVRNRSASTLVMSPYRVIGKRQTADRRAFEAFMKSDRARNVGLAWNVGKKFFEEIADPTKMFEALFCTSHGRVLGILMSDPGMEKVKVDPEVQGRYVIVDTNFYQLVKGLWKSGYPLVNIQLQYSSHRELDACTHESLTRDKIRRSFPYVAGTAPAWCNIVP